jgi:ABC-type Mn2+/Zn2+ transport system permease subunit
MYYDVMGYLTVIILGATCGLIGSIAMNLFMRTVSHAYSQRVDMVIALGSFFTGKIDNAATLGTLIHSITGIVFGILYFLLMNAMNSLNFPSAVFLGLGFGFFHGLTMSYCLMFIASERHPIKAYRKATLEQGLLHLVGHVIFGGVAGLIGGLLALGL